MQEHEINAELQALQTELRALQEELRVLKTQASMLHRWKKHLPPRAVLLGITMAILCSGSLLYGAQIVFSNGSIISASEVNANFTELYTAVATATGLADRVTSLETRFSGARQWNALGAHAIGRDIDTNGSEYAIRLSTTTSRPTWGLQLPDGATITEWSTKVAKCNDQTGNTLTCKLNRYEASNPANMTTLASFSLAGALSPCTQSQTITTFSPSPVVSDNYIYDIHCTQTADGKDSSIQLVSVSYTLPDIP